MKTLTKLALAGLLLVSAFIALTGCSRSADSVTAADAVTATREPFDRPRKV
jgi:hypothetical protein